MKIEHPFLTTCRDIEDLFLETLKLSSFCRKLEKQAKIDTDRYPYEKYVGDGFEFLIEILIKISECDNRIGIAGYTPVLNKDNGVDGYGLNLKGEKCAVQIKYRGDSSSFLSAESDRLDSFLAESVFENVLPEEKDSCKRHFIFTTAEGLHYYTQKEKFRNSVKTYGYKELRELLDNNLHFWRRCLEIIKENLSK